MLAGVQAVHQGGVPLFPLSQVFGPRFGIGPQLGITGVQLLEEDLTAIGVQDRLQTRPTSG